MAKASPARVRANRKYDDKAYFKTLVRFPKHMEAEIRAAAGESLNGYITRAVFAQMERDAQETSND